MTENGWRALYPFPSRWWERAGVRLHYLDEGSGEPVVMVHGNPSWSFYFRRLVAALRGSYRVIVPDHVGMGLSDKPDESRYDYRLKSRIDDLEELLESLGARENVTLVVHDWGGAIGLGWACRHPGRVKRLVILNTAAFGPPEGRSLPWFLGLARTPLGALAVRGFNAFCVVATRLCCRRRPMEPEVKAGFLAPYGSWRERLAVQRFVEDIPMSPEHPSWELLQWIDSHLGLLSKLPTLIVWGGLDPVFDRAYFEEFCRRFPDAEKWFIEDAGHYVLEDAPEEAARLVADFLART